MAHYQLLFPDHPLPTKLTHYGLTDIPPAEKDIIIDAGDWQTAQDCAQSLVFHHPEVLTLIPAPAGLFLPIVETAKGLQTLATPQSGVEHQFTYDPSSTPPATISFKNYYLRWLKISVDQYGPPPNSEPIGSTQSLGYLSPPDSIMAVPLPPRWSDFPFTFDEGASPDISPGAEGGRI